MEREHCIVIDAGHGGIDGGATSCTGKLESTFNLEIALRLNDLLHFLGYETKMIRTTDTSVYTKGETIAQKKISDLKERVRMVNETENALLVSIHQNNFSDGRYSGAQIFYADTEGSQLLAKQLQDAFVSTLNPGSNRQSKQSSGVYLMEHIDCTGVLVECGFLSNAQEEAKLRSPDYQQRLCCVIAATMIRFLSNT
ncbi:MAG: N-acetylmuramoyl-L-alanine amidase [Oscillospiraceae bacterium]|nr:N-acetylmuramoyl-L-alanine amidase [Oscillospiraceae bacterium]